MVDFGKLRSSLRRLEEQYANHRNENAALSDLDREAIAESVIQRFKTCHDCLWKVLKSYLMENLGIADAPNSPKPVFRIAHERLRLEAPIEQWLRYPDARTGTAHDHDGEQAKACLALVPDFIRDAIDIYETMSDSPWMEMSRSIDLTSDQRNTVEVLIARYLSDTEAWAYGSRVGWTSRPQSDLDVVVKATPEQADAVSTLREAFEDSSLPFRVNLFIWEEVPDLFREQIVQDHIVMSRDNDTSRESEGLTPNHWRRAVLRDVTDLTLSSVDKRSRTNERSVMLCNYTDAYNNSFIRADMDFMKATATDHEIARCSLAAGDVIITKDSEKHDDIGVPALVRERIEGLVCGYHLAILRPRRSEVDGGYLYYALSTEEIQRQFHSYANGVTRFGLRKADIGLVEIPVPTLHEQRSIAHVLGTLDDKIELNRRMNATLEGMARALFKDWFVDFGPVRAKMEGRDTGLPKEIARLFPDRLVDSDLGEIPEGWETTRLDNVATITKGRSYRRRELVASDTALVTLKSFARGGGYRPEGLKSFSGVYKHDQVVQPGDVIVACTDVTQAAEVVGRSAVIGETSSFRTLVASLDVLIVRPKGTVPGRAFVYYVLGTENSVAHSLARTTGTTVLHLSKDAVASFRFVLPQRRLIERFEQCVGALCARMQTNASGGGSLTNLRDTLLPKLISGQLRATGLEGLGVPNDRLALGGTH